MCWIYYVLQGLSFLGQSTWCLYVPCTFLKLETGLFYISIPIPSPSSPSLPPPPSETVPITYPYCSTGMVRPSIVGHQSLSNTLGKGLGPPPCFLTQGVSVYVKCAPKVPTYARDENWTTTGRSIDFRSLLTDTQVPEVWISPVLVSQLSLLGPRAPRCSSQLFLWVSTACSGPLCSSLILPYKWIPFQFSD